MYGNEGQRQRLVHRDGDKLIGAVGFQVQDNKFFHGQALCQKQKAVQVQLRPDQRLLDGVGSLYIHDG